MDCKKIMSIKNRASEMHKAPADFKLYKAQATTHFTLVRSTVESTFKPDLLHTQGIQICILQITRQPSR
jgi:hypothetical protein